MSKGDELVHEIILAGLTKVVDEGEFYFEDGKFELSSDGKSYMDAVSLVAKDVYDIFSDRSITDMEA